MSELVFKGVISPEKCWLEDYVPVLSRWSLFREHLDIPSFSLGGSKIVRYQNIWGLV